jgi:HD-GYP domain-containing protein (c-di-GMP phosphodiesterase class II)
MERRFAAEAQARRNAWEVEKISGNLAATYEEICLLHEMTNHLRLSATDEQLSRLALERLLVCLPAESAAMQFLPVADATDVTYKARTQSELVTLGNSPFANARFSELIQHLELNAGCGPFVANRDITGVANWPFPEVRQFILVPVAEGEKLFGWLALFNHIDGEEFGSIEASLLASVGAILGVHCGNRDLYRLQDEFLASVVRAMTSAIDAKDPYTCGHSDRVARIAVRLARELGFSTEALANIYMAGLLHDVGKIGIDDQVLRKHGKLTTEEFEHIKEHPDLGCKILAGLKPLADVLPAVRHHHEQWDGRGYPAKLAGNEIPLIARIVAVADAYDAMISDRPYRQGMPLEKVEEIFSKGSAQQWDKQVIDAYFTVREEVRDISRRERANLSLDVARWT